MNIEAPFCGHVNIPVHPRHQSIQHPAVLSVLHCHTVSVHVTSCLYSVVCVSVNVRVRVLRNL